MSDQEETFCRLCAEVTPKDQLISSTEDVAISSKIASKMMWINVDISSSSTLPTTICFSCFDLLERTWSFLHNVRVAQTKLNSIFMPKVALSTSSDKTNKNSCSDAGKPVDSNWDDFKDGKLVKDDPESVTDNQENSLEVTVKAEHESDNEPSRYDSDGMNTSDSELPLLFTVKKKKVKKKKKPKFDPEMFEADILKAELDTDAIPLDIADLNLTWDDQMCRCAICDAVCKNTSLLQQHAVQIHLCCCTFKCYDCGKIISNYKSFVNHVRSHKKTLRHCCEFCNKQFTLSALVKKHIAKFHSFTNTCQNCGILFENQELLQDHLTIYGTMHKRNKKRNELTGDLKCNHCCREFKSRSNLQQHKLVHTERSRDFSCHVCGKMFFTKGTLSTHMGTHEDAKPFKCEFCPMAFRARGNLNSHISLHSGAKPFVCEQCGKSFRVKRHLKSHSIIHTDLMPYVCEYCNKSFRFKTRLNLHIRQHTGAKPYNCIYCQRDFTNGSNYKKHMKRRHNIDTSKKKYVNVVSEDPDDVNSQAQ